MTTKLSQQDNFPVSMVCGVLDLSRSSYYYQATPADDQPVRAAIKEVVRAFPTYGSRRVAVQLRRVPHRLTANRKRTQRLMRAMDLQPRQKRRKCHTTDSAHAYARYPNLVADLAVTFPDQVWASDITYIRLHSRFVYLAVIMDLYTRAIRGWHLSHSLDERLSRAALQMALTDHVPLIHHSDQGVQYAAHAYIDLLTQHAIQISMSARGTPEENGYAERLIRTIKEEEVYLSEYRDFADARAQIGHFIEEVYQTKRIHSALGYLTPVEFEAVWQHAQRQDAFSLDLA